MALDRYYVDSRLVVRANITRFVAGPFDTELAARQWLDTYLEAKADELMRMLVGITERQIANQEAMTLCADTSKES